MKAPQLRKTEKKITDRDLGHPNITLKGSDESIYMAELGESRWPPTFRGREEIETLHDFCNAWLEYDDEHGDDE